MAKKFLTGINMNGNAITNVAVDPLASAPTTPVTGQVYFDTPNKLLKIYDGTAWNAISYVSYVDGAIQGIKGKTSVKCATTANITLSGTQTIDTISVVAGDRVLVKDQTTTSANGIYVVASGAWTRATDSDTWSELVSAFVFVEQGSVNADTGWLSTVDQGGTLGTTAVAFTQFSSAGQISIISDSNNIITWVKTGNNWQPTISITNLMTQLVANNVARVKTFQCASGTTTNCGHNFGIVAVAGKFPQHVTVQEVLTGQEVIVDWTATDANTTAVTFPAGTTLGQYLITIVA